MFVQSQNTVFYYMKGIRPPVARQYIHPSLVAVADGTLMAGCKRLVTQCNKSNKTIKMNETPSGDNLTISMTTSNLVCSLHPGSEPSTYL